MGVGPGVVSGAAVRPDAPNVDDYGMVVRPLFAGPVPVIIIGPVVITGSVSIIGTVTTVEESSTASDLTSVPASAVPVTLLAANAARLGFTIRNTSLVDVLYVKASTSGGPVSSAFHSVALRPSSYYEDPYHYVGEVTGIWAPGATGTALITEYLP